MRPGAIRQKGPGERGGGKKKNAKDLLGGGYTTTDGWTGVHPKVYGISVASIGASGASGASSASSAMRNMVPTSAPMQATVSQTFRSVAPVQEMMRAPTQETMQAPMQAAQNLGRVFQGGGETSQEPMQVAEMASPAFQAAEPSANLTANLSSPANSLRVNARNFG